ncbi:putative RNA binding protein Rnp24 [Ilyonectria robusta]|uniref:putative RNA binding protein Rnp24 n=1 Tax=Ilyonectria robusta TaxID=1079257 RepID=UPI001E8EB7A9|nr:putative RNA binding protein Rnp24 [Ilyonectria robusta]KAH8699634.1 putative RNA binding protein Rnp24 [Ilyonectria robusta]
MVDAAAEVEKPEKPVKPTEVEQSDEPATESAPEATPSGKRKAEIEEIEVDVSAPEPPSKRAKRALKKGKSLPAKQDSDDESGEKKGKKDARSEHGVWVGNLPFFVGPVELRKWLIDNSGGVITEENITRIKLPTNNKEPGRDKSSKPTNKGFAYVDFTDIGPKVAAIALSENDLGARKLLIKDSKSFEGRPKKEAEPEPGTEEGDAAQQKKDANASRKIFVGNMGFKTTDEDVSRNFEKCGEIEWVKVATFEDTGKCKGYGWVKFKEPEAAAWAVKGFVKIKEEIETEKDFKEGSDDDEDEEPQQKQFKMRKWWVNRMLGRELKIELAEDDQVRYKKRFKKNPNADDSENPRNRPPARKAYRPNEGAEGADSGASKPLKEATDISVASTSPIFIMYESQSLPQDIPSQEKASRLSHPIVKYTLIPPLRLDQALSQVQSPSVPFTLHFDPYQPSSDLPDTVPDRSQWALQHKHNDNPEAQQVYQAHMTGLAEQLGVPLTFTGPTGNSFHAHRVIQLVQESDGAAVTNRLVDELFRRYFAEGQHPAADDTLVAACIAAGVPEEQAKALVADREKGQKQVKEKIRSVGMDIDAVPVVMVEGRRRDLTLTGLKQVADYVKALETVVKESS